MNILAALHPLGDILVLMLGLVLGSFLNVCIHRLPRGVSVVAPGSACPACGASIRWYDNIPVLSWLLLRARCRNCKAAIPTRYAIVEISIAITFWFCFVHFGSPLEAIKFAALGFLLIGLIVTDMETRLLPDALTLPGLGLGLIFALFVPIHDMVSDVFLYAIANPLPLSASATTRIFSIGDAVLGAATGAFFLYGIRWLYWKLRGIEGLGLGDVKLIAMIGAFVGLRLTIWTLLLASVTGALAGLWAAAVVWIKRLRRPRSRPESVGRAHRRAWNSARIMMRSYPLPFGVFLGSAAILAVLLSDSL